MWLVNPGMLRRRVGQGLRLSPGFELLPRTLFVFDKTGWLVTAYRWDIAGST